MRCPRCDAALDSGATSCPECGAETLVDAGQPTAAGPEGSHGPEVLHFRVAGFFERALAGVVDGIIILPLFALLAWGGSAVTGVRIPRAREITFDLIVGLIIEKNGPVVFWVVMLVILVFLYCFIFIAARGQTPGKRLVGVRVVTWYGEPPTLARSLVRTFGYLVSAALLWLGFIWIGFDREKRGLHDWIAGTYVVRS
jgi:uncharacterized RDD family membrane protein YckC